MDTGTEELEDLLGNDAHVKLLWGGVHPNNHLPDKVTYPQALVFNTDPCTEPGEHWVAVYLTPDGQGEYFDSYGVPPTGRVKRFLGQRTWNVIYNGVQLQGLLSSTCGHYCLFYLLHRCRNYSMEDIVNMFSSDMNENDKHVRDFIEDYIDYP